MDESLRDGLALIEQGKYESAHQLAISGIHKNIADPAPYYLLARVAEDHQNFTKADELYRRASELGPDEPLYLSAYGQYLISVGQQRPALGFADRAGRLPNDNAVVADTIGVIYSRAGFHENAIPFFKQAVSLDSAPANFHYNLGASLQFSGDFRGAEAAYMQAIKRQPNAYRAYSSLVGLSRQTTKTNKLDELAQLFTENRDDPDARLHLGHAVAKTLEDLDRHAESLEWLRRGKQLKRRTINYAIEDDIKLFDAAKLTTAPMVATSERPSDAAPVFIIGLPRTGTTLVDRILSSHPEVVSAGELNTFAGLVKDLAQTSSNRVLDAETLSRVCSRDLASLGHDYIDATRDLARGALRFTDKMPLNFFYAGLIHKALPNARIVVLRRDPMDSCLSNYRQLFSTAYSYYNYSFDLIHTAAYFRAFDELMTHWRCTLPPNRFMEIHYEDIVHEQEKETRRLLEFCELPWDEVCMRFHENSAPVSTASSVQVRKPLYSGSIGRWKKYGNKLVDLKNGLGVSAD